MVASVKTTEATSDSTLPPHNTEHLTHPKYRADIDGLRAIAVLLVVGFHAFPAWVKGGFVGVDIFFVISGYLISTIIFGSLERNSFSFVEFYSRRIKRIFPALLLVLIACYAFGWFVLLADEYKRLGKHIVAGAGFVSNIVLWNESGYFDDAAESKPLLHLWSLGIEEQFYIIWPLLLWAAWKKRLNLLTITVAVAVVSFILNIMGIRMHAVATFYSPQTRFWELLIGSLLAWLTLRKEDVFSNFKPKLDVWLGKVVSANAHEMNGTMVRNVQSLFGAVLIAIAVLVITKERDFPGWWAVLITLGAALIISAGTDAWLNRAVLSNRLLVWFGLISFPLYLWHWPLLSFARIVGSEAPSSEIRIAAVVISIVLAWLTYRLIEKPIRFANHSKSKTIALVAFMALVGYVGYNCEKRDGLSFREVNKVNLSKESGFDGGAGIVTLNECGLGDQEKTLFAVCAKDSRQPIRYALLGDSKAAAIFSGLIRTSNNNGRWLFIGGQGPNGAPVPVISSNEIYKQYQHLTTLAVKTIAENKDIEKVVLVTATRTLFQLKSVTNIEDLPDTKNVELALDGLEETIKQLTTVGKKIVFVVDNPTLPRPNDCIDRKTSSTIINVILVKNSHTRCHLKITRHLELSKQYRDLLSEIEKRHPDFVKVFDTTKFMCDADQGLCEMYENGRLLYSYADHISDYAAGKIGVELNAFLQKY